MYKLNKQTNKSNIDNIIAFIGVVLEKIKAWIYTKRLKITNKFWKISKYATQKEKNVIR